MVDGMSDSIQGSRIENLHSREVDRPVPHGTNFVIMQLLNAVLVSENHCIWLVVFICAACVKSGRQLECMEERQLS